MRTGQQRVVDAVCVVVLTGLVLFGLDETFSGRAYLVTGLVAVATVSLIAAAVATRGPRTELFLLWAAAAYVPVAAVVTLRSYEEGRLPAPSELLDVLTATLTAPGDLLTTIPPLDPVGTVLVLPFAIGYLLGGASVWMAFRTRRPLAPLVPLLLAQGVVILLGTHEPGERTLLVGAAVAGLAFWWASARGADHVDAGEAVIRHAGRGRATRAVAAGMVIAIAVGVVTQLVPSESLDGDRIVLRGRIGNGATIDEFDNPLISFRRFTRQDDGSPDNVFDKTLLVVAGLEGEESLRFVTLDTYDGQSWRADSRTVDDVEDDLFQRIGSVVAAPRPGRPIEVAVEVKGSYTGGWLPLVGQLTGVEFDFADGRAQREDVRYNPATSTATVLGGLGNGDDYTFTASVPITRLADNSTAYEVDQPLQPAGAPLDEYLQPWVRSGRPPLGQVLLLARYLQRNGRYSDGTGALDVPPGHDISRLTEQFFGARRIVGNDEQYAAFMALAANRLRVPARVVIGSVADNGKVRGRDVVAWVELRVRDGSWRVLPTSTFMSHRAPSRDDAPPQPPDDFVQDQLPDDSDQQNPDSPEQVPLPDGTAGPEQTDPTPDDIPLPGGWPTGLLLVGLLPWSVPALKVLRRLRRRRRPRPSARLVGAWRELLDGARDLGLRVPAGATRDMQALLLGVDPRLARHADSLIFGELPPSADQAAGYWREMDAAHRQLSRQRSPWRRVLALFTPASLLTSLRRRTPAVRAHPLLRALRPRLPRRRLRRRVRLS